LPAPPCGSVGPSSLVSPNIDISAVAENMLNDEIYFAIVIERLIFSQS
jgi:hypothetical protein